MSACLLTDTKVMLSIKLLTPEMNIFLPSDGVRSIL